MILMPNLSTALLKPVHRDDGDVLVLQILADELCAGAALRLAEMHSTEGIITRTRDVRMHAIRRDERDLGSLKNWRGGAAGSRVAARHREFHAVLPDQLVGGEHRFLGFCLVVIHDQFGLLAKDAAGGVDTLDG